MVEHAFTLHPHYLYLTLCNAFNFIQTTSVKVPYTLPILRMCHTTSAKLRTAISFVLWILLCIDTSCAAETELKHSDRRIQVYPRDQKVADDAIATFACDTNIYPIPSMFWRRNGRRLENYGSYQILRTWSGSVLRVEPVIAPRDDAMFECVIDDGVIQPLAETALLRVYPKEHREPEGFPMVTEQPTLRVVEEYQYCILYCPVSGDPEPRVTWFKDYVPVAMDTYRYEIIEEGSLRIGFTSLNDAGTYECIAENALGVAYSAPSRLIVEEYVFHP